MLRIVGWQNAMFVLLFFFFVSFRPHIVPISSRPMRSHPFPSALLSRVRPNRATPPATAVAHTAPLAYCPFPLPLCVCIQTELYTNTTPTAVARCAAGIFARYMQQGLPPGGCYPRRRQPRHHPEEHPPRVLRLRGPQAALQGRKPSKGCRPVADFGQVQGRAEGEGRRERGKLCRGGSRFRPRDHGWESGCA